MNYDLGAKTNSYKILSVMLMYPKKDTIDFLIQFYDAIENEKILSKMHILNIKKVISYFSKTDILSLQEEYVDFFDRQKTFSMHLFEHIHGDSRDRGQALVDLQNVYEDANLKIKPGELPDYLPLFLEYLSHLSYKDSSKFLGEIVNLIAVMAIRLKRHGSIYSHIFLAIESLSCIKADKKIIDKSIMAMPKQSKTDSAAIDKEWEELPAFSRL